MMCKDYKHAFQKMNPVVKRLWVNALRSGKFKQDAGYLNTEEGYCCMGVLCEISPFEKHWSDELNVYGWGKDYAVLPKKIMKWAGLIINNPIIKEEGEHLITASYANDALGKDFNTIADWIEQNL
jgi:hypothetical protein